ncbi:MAG: hypothetical protein D6748_06345, partial [Calditrichaeota bacterium]
NLLSFFHIKRSWLEKGGLALLDQFLFSGANFLVNILLARWLSPEEYGAFVVALSIYYLLAAFHTAILTEPMLVFGAGRYREQFRFYLTLLFRGHWGITVSISIALGLVSTVFWQLDNIRLVYAFGGLAVSVPFLLLFWLVRRVNYVYLKPLPATIGSASFASITILLLFITFHVGALTSFSAFVCFGMASLISSIGLLLQKTLIKDTRPQASLKFNEILKHHLSYGKWSIGSNLLSSLYLNTFNLILPIFVGLVGVARFRALLNFTLPLQQIFNSLTPLTLAYMARHSLQPKKLDQVIYYLTGIGLLVSIGYALIGELFGQELIRIFYATKYSNILSYLPLTYPYPLLTAFCMALGAAFRSTDRIKLVFLSYALSVAIVTAPAIILCASFGVLGAVQGYLLYGLVLSALLGTAWYRKRRMK